MFGMSILNLPTNRLIVFDLDASNEHSVLALNELGCKTGFVIGKLKADFLVVIETSVEDIDIFVLKNINTRANFDWQARGELHNRKVLHVGFW